MVIDCLIASSVQFVVTSKGKNHASAFICGLWAPTLYATQQQMQLRPLRDSITSAFLCFVFIMWYSRPLIRQQTSCPHYSCHVNTQKHTHTCSSLLTPAVPPGSMFWRMQAQTGMRSQTFLCPVNWRPTYDAAALRSEAMLQSSARHRDSPDALVDIGYCCLLGQSMFHCQPSTESWTLQSTAVILNIKTLELEVLWSLNYCSVLT